MLVTSCFELSSSLIVFNSNLLPHYPQHQFSSFTPTNKTLNFYFLHGSSSFNTTNNMTVMWEIKGSDIKVLFTCWWLKNRTKSPRVWKWSLFHIQLTSFPATTKVSVRILANLIAGLRISKLQPHNDKHAAAFEGEVYYMDTCRLLWGDLNLL